MPKVISVPTAKSEAVDSKNPKDEKGVTGSPNGAGSEGSLVRKGHGLAR